MSAGNPWPWLPRTLYRLSLLTALLLVALVMLSPIVDQGTPHPHAWRRLLAVFARDGTLRRTALASAVGLLVTASVFFGKDSQPKQAD